MKAQNTIKAAIYLRWSQDDGKAEETMSIGTQRFMLTKYAKDHGFGSVVEYMDDGWSGLNPQRPGFQQMLADAESGKINTILVKDMSRFGRLNALVQYYVELVFPQSGIRLIAVDDNYDSDQGDNEMMPFRTILNEWYCS